MQVCLFFNIKNYFCNKNASNIYFKTPQVPCQGVGGPYAMSGLVVTEVLKRMFLHIKITDINSWMSWRRDLIQTSLWQTSLLCGGFFFFFAFHPGRPTCSVKCYSREGWCIICMFYVLFCSHAIFYLYDYFLH